MKTITPIIRNKKTFTNHIELTIALILLIFFGLTSNTIVESPIENRDISTTSHVVYASPTTIDGIDVIIDNGEESEVFNEPTELIYDEVVSETEQTRYIVDEVPRYDQLQYTCPYGTAILANGARATVRNSGCGITCLSMVATYLLDDPSLTPDAMAEQFGRYNTSEGSAWSLFTESAEVLCLGEVKQAFDWKIGGVEEALRNGSVVISNQRKDIFTGSGHYIVLAGITEDGKIIVNDPNGENWNKPYLKEGFENGFNYRDIAMGSACYWIYQPKK